MKTSMVEKFHENAISIFFQDPTLVPADVNLISEQMWNINTYDLKDSMCYSLVNWDNVAEKKPNQQMRLNVFAKLEHVQTDD